MTFETLKFANNPILEGGLRTRKIFKKSYKNKPLITVITVVLNGEKNLRDLYKHFDLEPPESESSTIAGHIMDIAKKIPLFGETVKDNVFSYKVLSHSRKQISKIEINKIK